MNYFSPLRYPGGKGKVAEFFQQVVIKNDLLDGFYVEPYVGGGSVALTLLYRELVKKIIINDKDRSIYAFWYSVLNQTEELCRLIEETPITMDVWKEQKAIQNRTIKGNVDLLTLGFSTFFLNRTNRSGIINAGVIGGNDQTGNYKIDARYNKTQLIERIKKIAEYTERIELYNEDAVELTKTLINKLPSKSIFYFDPPYYIKGQGLYMNYYTDKDHEEIAKTIACINSQKWIITYDNVDFIVNLYEQYRKQEFELLYSANNSSKSKGKEIMFFSDNISFIPPKIL